MATHSHPGAPKAPPVPAASEVQLPPYFLVRPGTTKHTASGTVTTPGPMVPLVPVDQLPDWIDVVGIPRALDVEQVRGLCNLGPVAKDTECYDVRIYSLDAAFGGAGRRQQRQQRPNSKVSRVKSSRMDRGATVFASAGGRAGRDTQRRSVDGNGAHNQRDSSSSSKTSSRDSAGTNVVAHKTRTKDNSNSGNTTITTRSSRNDNGNKIDTPTTTEHPVASQPPVPSTPSNPHPTLHLHHQGPVPPPSHPASRLLGTFANGVSQYTPSQPMAPLPTLHAARVAPRTTTTTTKAGSHNSGTSSVYCRHWCHHGTCKWDPFCRYQHVMPSTPEGLREVGLADLPRWWKNAMGMALGMGGVVGGGGGGGGLGTGMGMGGWFGGMGGGAVSMLNRKDLREMLDRWEMMDLGSGGNRGRRETRRKGKGAGAVEKGRLEEEVEDSGGSEVEDEDGPAQDVVEDTETTKTTNQEVKEVEKVQEKLVDV